MSRIAVVGQGAWGQALAQVARAANHAVAVWSRSQPDPKAIAGAEALVLAVPAQAVRDAVTRIAPFVVPATPVIIAAKGIEQGSGRFMAEVLGDCAPDASPMVLSGPSFAADVRRGLPTAVVLAAERLDAARAMAQALSLPQFRIYASDDILGVELGGALKNVLAIACGISDGRGLGDSARAALTTRGFAELRRFGRKLGAKPETLMGLSGLGDLLLTCSSRQSRNYAFGFAIGEGRSVAAALAAATGVVEGAHTVKIAQALARKYAVDMPIVEAVHAVVDGNAAPDEVIARLLARPAGAELR